MPSLADLLNGGATPQTQGMMSGGVPLSQIFHSFADPDAVLNSPVAQVGSGFAGIGMIGGGGNAVQALQDQARRIAAGFEGLSGDAKYAALRDIAAKLRGLQGAPDLSAGQSYIPSDVSSMRDIMERLIEARQNPMQYK